MFSDNQKFAGNNLTLILLTSFFYEPLEVYISLSLTHKTIVSHIIRIIWSVSDVLSNIIVSSSSYEE